MMKIRKLKMFNKNYKEQKNIYNLLSGIKNKKKKLPIAFVVF